MTETKQIKKPKTDKYTKVSKSGKFIENKDGYFWEQKILTSRYDREFKLWNKLPEVVTLLKPEDSPLKLKKSTIAHIIWQKEEQNKEKWNGTEKSYWYMKLKYDIRPEASNLYFAESDGKIFIRDLHYNVTSPIALNESNSNYKCEQLGDIEKISAERATEIVKATGTRLIFGKVETDSKGNITSFGTVV